MLHCYTKVSLQEMPSAKDQIPFPCLNGTEMPTLLDFAESSLKSNQSSNVLVDQFENLPDNGFFSYCGVSWLSGFNWIQTLVFLIAECGFESPAVTLMSLSKTLSHCFILRLERKTVGPMCCVRHVKEPSALIEKRWGSPRVPGCGCWMRRSTLYTLTCI